MQALPVEIDVGVVGRLDPFFPILATDHGEEDDDVAGASQLTDDPGRFGKMVQLDGGLVRQVDCVRAADQAEPVSFERQPVGAGAGVVDLHGLGDQLEGGCLMVQRMEHGAGAGRIGETDDRFHERSGLRGQGFGQ